MIIGILSDTHGNVKRASQAIKAMKPHSPAHIIHCGDIGSESVITELAAGCMNPQIPVTCVLGNVDVYNHEIVSSWPHVRIEGRFAQLELDGNKIAVVHGDDFLRLRGAIERGQFDYVFTGHTHMRADELEGRTRVINPGALQRTNEPGCAVLDLCTGKLTFLDVR
ncbi:MAG TPA: YfcE family phosphodiesterase [Kiritimatiellia bacterium]|nr:YfcE family phosphodiesterase [Kiritimatiellia bacterium]